MGAILNPLYLPFILISDVINGSSLTLFSLSGSKRIRNRVAKCYMKSDQRVILTFGYKNFELFYRINSRLKFILIWKCKWFIFVTWVEVQKKSRFWGHKCTVHNNVTFLTSLNYKNCCNFSTVIILSSLIYDGVNQVNQNVLEAYLQITLQGRRRL